MKKSELRELQKQEVIKRLEILQQVYKVHPNVLEEFKQDETIYYSERKTNLYDGILFWLNNRQEFVNAAKEIENKYNIFIYHCILNHTINGDWLTMLFISSTPDNWEDEKIELKSGVPFAYVYDFGGFGSEFGPIEIKGINGGITRVS